MYWWASGYVPRSHGSEATPVSQAARRQTPEHPTNPTLGKSQKNYVKHLEQALMLQPRLWFRVSHDSDSTSSGPRSLNRLWYPDFLTEPWGFGGPIIPLHTRLRCQITSRRLIFSVTNSWSHGHVHVSMTSVSWPNGGEFTQPQAAKEFFLYGNYDDWLFNLFNIDRSFEQPTHCAQTERFNNYYEWVIYFLTGMSNNYQYCLWEILR